MTRKPASGSPVVNAGDPAFAAPPAVAPLATHPTETRCTDGVDVRPNSGPGNALENEGLRNMDLISKGVIELPPFGTDEGKKQEQILSIYKKVVGWYSDINIDIVISRPLTGDYLMTVVGGKQSDIVQMAGVVGISPGDCKNATEIREAQANCYTLACLETVSCLAKNSDNALCIKQ